MRTHCITIDLANQGRRQVRARFDGGRMSSDGGALLVELFLDSHAAAPEEIVLDVDAAVEVVEKWEIRRIFQGRAATGISTARLSIQVMTKKYVSWSRPLTRSSPIMA